MISHWELLELIRTKAGYFHKKAGSSNHIEQIEVFARKQVKEKLKPNWRNRQTFPMELRLAVDGEHYELDFHNEQSLVLAQEWVMQL